MEYKILEQNGIEIENIDGGALNNLASNGKSGVVAGVLNECSMFAQGNVVSVNSGLLLIKGIRVKLLSSVDFALPATAGVDTTYCIVAKVVLSNDRSVSFEMFLTTEQTRIQENLYKNNSGTYELELGTFVHSSDKIINLKMTAEILKGNGAITIDTELSDTSENPVQNKAIKNYIANSIKNFTEKDYVDNAVNENKVLISENEKSINVNKNKTTALENALIGAGTIAKADGNIDKDFQQTGGTALEGLTILDGSYAEVKEIQGDTVRWYGENLIPYPYSDGASKTEGGITFTVNANGSLTINGSTTEDNATYLLAESITLSAGTYYANGKIADGINLWGSFGILDIFEKETFTESVSGSLRIVVAPNTTVNNLTVYPYVSTTPPTLKNAQISGIKSTGKNWFDSELLLKVNGWIESDGVYSGNSRELYNVFKVANGGFFGVLNFTEKMSISFMGKNKTLANSTTAIIVRYTDGTSERTEYVNSTDWALYTLTTAQGKTIDTIGFTLNMVDGCSLKDICIRIGENTEYVPYTESVMSLPQETELGKWDYIQDGKIVRQTETIVFDTEEKLNKWNLVSGGTPYFAYNLGNVGYVVADNIVCNRFEQSAISSVSSDIGINVINSTAYGYSRIVFRPPSVTTWNELKEYLKANLLVVAYKTATSITTDIAFDNQYLVWDKGTETVIGNSDAEYGAKPTINNEYMILLGGNE